MKDAAALPTPQQDLALLEDAARHAGEIAMGYWQKSPEVSYKPDNQGPVSEADLAVNAALEKQLMAARPEYGWLSEESPDNGLRLEKHSQFILDPIDGTRAFINGKQGFSHAVAVARDNIITAAVVHLPALGLTYTATMDGPALCNGKPLAPQESPLAEAEVLTAAVNLEARFWKNGPPAFTRISRPSLAWRLCLVAEGRFHAALTMHRAWEWDIAAASLIAKQAGAQITDKYGRMLSFNNPTPQVDGLITAAPELHQALSLALRPA